MDKTLFLQLRDVAVATCGNAYLMQSGEILANREYKALDFWSRLECILYYRYLDNTIVKI